MHACSSCCCARCLCLRSLAGPGKAVHDCVATLQLASCSNSAACMHTSTDSPACNCPSVGCGLLRSVVPEQDTTLTYRANMSALPALVTHRASTSMRGMLRATRRCTWPRQTRGTRRRACCWRQARTQSCAMHGAAAPWMCCRVLLRRGGRHSVGARA